MIISLLTKAQIVNNMKLYKKFILFIWASNYFANKYIKMYLYLIFMYSVDCCNRLVRLYAGDCHISKYF